MPHGLRSTFRDWTAEQGFDNVISEMALGHRVGSEVELAYRRTDLLDKRRALMLAWADHLLGVEPASDVVPLARVAAE